MLLSRLLTRLWLAAMSVQSAYDRWSLTYDDDANVTKDLDRHVTSEALGPLRGRAALELGCGTGKNTSLLADRFDRVWAIDFSEGMLVQARQRVTASNVTFLRADITQRWPCDDRCADLATINLVLEHVADLAHVFSEAARVLRPGGRLFVCELHPFRQYLGSQARFEHDGETVRIPSHPHHVSDFTAAASAAGFGLVRLDEWWHADYGDAIPRLISLLLRR